jgi:hypothetical protein
LTLLPRQAKATTLSCSPEQAPESFHSQSHFLFLTGLWQARKFADGHKPAGLPPLVAQCLPIPRQAPWFNVVFSEPSFKIACLELALYHSLGKLPEPESTHEFF